MRSFKPVAFITVPVVLCLFICILASGCKENYTPKPRSYFRIDFPPKKYVEYHAFDCGYSFEIPDYAKIVPFSGYQTEPCWINIVFPGYKGTIHLTYKRIERNLSEYAEDIHILAYKHTIKADDIIEKPFSYPERNVSGMIYDIRGNTASSFSFYATDSSKHFLSGALYFSVRPNKDSLAPVIKFFSADIEHLIQTLNWN